MSNDTLVVKLVNLSFTALDRESIDEGTDSSQFCNSLWAWLEWQSWYPTCDSAMELCWINVLSNWLTGKGWQFCEGNMWAWTTMCKMRPAWNVTERLTSHGTRDSWVSDKCAHLLASVCSCSHNQHNIRNSHLFDVKIFSYSF